MNSNLIDSCHEKSRELVERATRFNETLFEHFTRATELQVLTFRRYADTAVEQARKVNDVKDLDDLKRFSQEQAAALKTMSDQFAEDWQAWQEYFNQSREQLKHLFNTEE